MARYTANSVPSSGAQVVRPKDESGRKKEWRGSRDCAMNLETPVFQKNIARQKHKNNTFNKNNLKLMMNDDNMRTTGTL